jgi:hypothetical protein
MMTVTEFRNIAECPSNFSPALKGLWYDKQGDWNTAHEIVQNASDRDSAWVHAYLHREEGDRWNANYWYRRCGQPEFQGSLQDEWKHIARNLLS